MSRGYLWENLGDEVAAEFDGLGRPAPLSHLIKAGIQIIERTGEEVGPPATVMHDKPQLKSKRAYARSAASGQCVKCAQPAREGKRTCAACSAKATERNRQRRRGMRERMPELREGLTCKFEIYTRDDITVDGYVTTGCYPDGRLGEVFVKVGKVGDESALLDQWAIAVSTALQYGAPFEDFVFKFLGTRFEPSGSTTTPEVKRCTSPIDFVARWLLSRYAKPEWLRERFGKGEIK